MRGRECGFGAGEGGSSLKPGPELAIFILCLSVCLPGMLFMSRDVCRTVPITATSRSSRKMELYA